ncbi:hypothetical protein AB1Y20_001067 [Prymnesium parvum]|uniref:PCI domain-containing protein n=1 Tax=Prymnesium parvum TaxID=97485 RepID=A0AB34K766_PRYPA
MGGAPDDKMEVEPTKVEAPVDHVTEFTADFKASLAAVDRYISTREPRFVHAALTLVGKIRSLEGKEGYQGKGASVLNSMVAHLFPAAHPHREMFRSVLSPLTTPLEAVAVDEKEKAKPLNPETEVLLSLLVLVLLVDAKKKEEACTCADKLCERLLTWNRRTLDPFAERIYFYASWAAESAGRLQDMRSTLLAAHRTACLHHNTACQATTLNLLLRNYLHYKLFDQADKLLTKATFPEQASITQLARFLYYNGRIKALQLEYTEAHRCLQQAQRKAPQSKALGFRLTVHKLGTIVQLLLGEIPDRAVFRNRQSRGSMLPYLKLVQAVRLGDLASFKSSMETHADVYHADGNYTLVMRLRQNVIRAGLRNISVAYSRISLADVAAKLHLDNPEDMEPIAAKAIRDGVIDAKLDHAEGTLISEGPHDVYSTLEPQAAFHKRITFCLNVHNDAVKAMSYPPDAHKGDLPDAETIKERQREEQELAQSLAEEDDEF